MAKFPWGHIRYGRYSVGGVSTGARSSILGAGALSAAGEAFPGNVPSGVRELFASPDWDGFDRNSTARSRREKQKPIRFG